MKISSEKIKTNEKFGFRRFRIRENMWWTRYRSDQKERYILPIISCYVKSSKSKVDNALLEVKVLRDSGKDSIADSALNFILLLVNVNELFDVALGLYDFDLVLLVAEKSDKDPKEFLPFLNELKKLPNENYRWEIKMFIRNWSAISLIILYCKY